MSLERLSPVVLVLCLAACTRPGTAVDGPVDEANDRTTVASKADPLAVWADEHLGPNRFYVPISHTDLRRGAEDGALVTIVIKPFATKLDMPHVSDGKLSARAVLAANAQRHGWALHQRFAEAGHLITTTERAEALEIFVDQARRIGVPNLDRFRDALESEMDPLLATTALAEQLGVDRAPFLFVNGAPYTDVSSSADLKQIHAAERELAMGLVGAGARPGDIHSTIMKIATPSREATTPYRPPFDGVPLGSATLPGDILVEDFVLGEGESVAEGSATMFDYRAYYTKSTNMIGGSRTGPTDMVINDVARNRWGLGEPVADALLGMKPGGKRRVTIPAKDTIVTIELISVGPAPKLAPLDAFAGKPLSTRRRRGVAIHEYAAGTGEPAKSGDQIEIHYVTHLVDGTEVDTTHGSARGLTVTLGSRLIYVGLHFGLEDARVGSLRKLVIPPELGIDDPVLKDPPAHSKLIVYVEVMAISPGNN